MNLRELDSFKLSDSIKFHATLNPVLFNDEHLDPEVRNQLLLIAQDFIEHLGITDFDVKDITLSGSNAAYTYTPHSDIDLHILVDIDKLRNNEVYREFFNTKKVVYNNTHDINIHGYDVELYIQDSTDPVQSLGEYSVLNDRWIKFPVKRKANLDQTASKEKFKKLIQLSELALRTSDVSKIDSLLDTIRKYRQAGLDEHGEFGPENLAYKALRSHGIVDKLYKHAEMLHSQDLSLPEEVDYVEENDELTSSLMQELASFNNLKTEDYDPNGPPPGPEFKPTMPKGTVRVDVSDVYDWYKLGQNISNLDRADKKMFGKGPPSTIVSFGSEDAEHNYINSLNQLGLDTTDIDPVDPNQPRGMKRQKVDPTYNVNENSPEGSDDAAETFKAHLIRTLPQLMKLFANVGKGWSPSKEQMLDAVDTGYMIMKHTGDAKQAGKAVMDELNTLYRMNQGKQGISEGAIRIPVTELSVNRNATVHKWQLRNDQNFKLSDEVPSIILKDVTVAIDEQAYDQERSLFAFLQGERTNNIPEGLTEFPIAYRRNGVYPFIDKRTGEPIERVDYVKFDEQGKVTGYKQGLAEAFDQPYKLTWTKGDYGDTDAIAKLPDGTNLLIMFDQQQGDEGEKVIQVEFYRNNSQEVTSDGDAQKVFATVLTAIQQFVKKYKPQKLTFSASKDNWAKQQQNSDSRAKLYDRLVQRYSRAWGYRAFRADTGDLVIYQLSRIPKQKSVGEQGVSEARELKEQDLFEINMGGKSLRREAAKTGANAGMEFEMIVTDVSGDDDDDDESEPDWDANESARNDDDIRRFFYDAVYNSLRDVNRMISQMQTDHRNWQAVQFESRWDSEPDEFIYNYLKDNISDDDIRDLLDLEPDDDINRREYLMAADSIATSQLEPWYEDAKTDAREQFYDNDNFNFEEWLNDADLDSMRDIHDRYSGDVQWPYYTEPEPRRGGGKSVQNIADSFSAAVGRPAKTSDSYHSHKQERPGYDDFYVVEPDGSLDPDDPANAGLEFVSPYMPIDKMLVELNKVKQWADRNDCYTNKSTGLHINISVPNYSQDKLDYVKLALLMGDEYVLKQFGRVGNAYAKSALGKVRDRVRDRPVEAEYLFDKMKGHMGELASKAIHSGITDKYTSVNTKDGHIEFRSPGGDWLNANFSMIENTLLRFTVAMSAALDPEAYRQEYLKKLYKLLAPKGENDPLAIFAKYSAGELPKAALKNFVRQAQLERQGNKPAQPAQPAVPEYGSVQWSIINKNDETVYTFWNRNVQADANEIARQWLIRNDSLPSVDDQEPFKVVRAASPGNTLAQQRQAPAASNITNPSQAMAESSGYIPSEKEKNDPRWKTALTVDVHPDSIKKNASKLGLGKIKRTGIPPQARSDGKF